MQQLHASKKTLLDLVAFFPFPVVTTTFIRDAMKCSFLQKNISMQNFSLDLGPTTAQKLRLLKMQINFF